MTEYLDLGQIQLAREILAHHGPRVSSNSVSTNNHPGWSYPIGFDSLQEDDGSSQSFSIDGNLCQELHGIWGRNKRPIINIIMSSLMLSTLGTIFILPWKGRNAYPLTYIHGPDPVCGTSMICSILTTSYFMGIPGGGTGRALITQPELECFVLVTQLKMEDLGTDSESISFPLTSAGTRSYLTLTKI